MSDTYIGWDGKPYPSPPPEGWYLASDGRWWAPDTGPGPAVASQPVGPAGMLFPAPGSGPGAHFDSAATALAASTADYPAPRPAADNADTAISTGFSTSTGPPALHDTMSMPAFAGPEVAPVNRTSNPYGPPTHTSSHRHPPGHDLPSGSPPGDGGQSRPGSTARIVAAAAGVLVVLALGVGAFLLLNRGDDETATGTTETTAAAPGTDSTLETTTISPTETTVDDGATTSSDSTAPVETTLAGEGIELVASFRSLLLDNGLTSEQLTDTQIQTFATSFCIFAQNSESADDFDEFRQQAIAETTSNLGSESLGLVIDAAVVTFCPEDAARLGISL